MSHPRRSLDPVIHSPVRLSIIAALSGVDQSDFASMRDTVEVSDSTLSKQITILEDADYLLIQKTFVGRRPRTYLSLTTEGRKAFELHLRALRAIVENSQPSA